GILHEDLRLLLDTSMPAKKKKALLGVADPKLGAAILEELGYQCQTGGVVPEILRAGVRVAHEVCGTRRGCEGCTRGVRVAHGVWGTRRGCEGCTRGVRVAHGACVCALGPLLTPSPRREWYGYHFPELIKIVPENYTYCRLAKFIGNRRELSEDRLQGLEDIVMDGAKAQAILDASRSSMGMDVSPLDLINIESFSRRVISLSEYRQGLQQYLRSKMSQVAPSLSALIGEVVSASTRGNTPKYGLIFHSTFIGRAAAKNKGRISRYLANKCTIASRIDCFSEVPTSVFGDKLREQVEERLAFYETGEPPRKNLEVMKEAVAEASEVVAEVKRKLEKKEKKRKKREKRRLEALAAAAEEAENSLLEPPQVRKPHGRGEEGREQPPGAPAEHEAPPQENHNEPKKKKKKHQEELEAESEELEPQRQPEENGLEDEALPKKKRKVLAEAGEEKKGKKKKKKKEKAKD
ncbi:NOP56 protein, partial [Urocolius indicus]|nr:NOP56 protein [Urocolius indicus]